MLRPDSLIAGALAGALVHVLASALGGSSPTPPPATETPAAAPDAPLLDAAPSTAEPEPLSAAGRLEDRLAQLEARLAQLEDRRRPVAPSADLATPASEVGPVEDEQRALVLDVLADEREREAEERRETLRARQLDRAADRADRLAEALGLGDAERDALAGLWGEAAERRLDVVERMRDVDPADELARELLRDELRAVGDWSDQELELRLGTDTAARVGEWEAENGRGGPGGGVGPAGLFGGRGRGGR